MGLGCLPKKALQQNVYCVLNKVAPNHSKRLKDPSCGKSHDRSHFRGARPELRTSNSPRPTGKLHEQHKPETAPFPRHPPPPPPKKKKKKYKNNNKRERGIRKLFVRPSKDKPKVQDQVGTYREFIFFDERQAWLQLRRVGV